MKVLHLLGQDQDIGGVLSVIRNVQQATVRWNWVHLVWVNRAYQESRRPALTYRFARHACSDSPNHLALLLRALRSFFELKQLLSGETFDVLHAHSRGTLLVAVMAARWLGRRTAFTNHNFARNIRLYRWAAAQKRMHTIVLTPNMLRHYGLKEDPPRVSIISECCADDFFCTELAAQAAARSANGRVRLLGVGNIIRWKNWHLLLNALQRLAHEERQRIECVHWGPTPNDPDSVRYAAELRRSVIEYGLQRQFVFGGQSHSIGDCLRQADWFVLPSTNEPCSVALIEALASGLPALASASGGNVDIIQEGKTGLMFEPESAVDLAAKLRLLLASHTPILPPAQIRESVRYRSATAVAERYETVYQCLLRSSHARDPEASANSASGSSLPKSTPNRSHRLEMSEP